jgi:hypothetical protein
VWVQIYFCTHELNPHPIRTELDTGFVSYLWVHLKPKKHKKMKLEKKPERDLKKTQNPKKI